MRRKRLARLAASPNSNQQQQQHQQQQQPEPTQPPEEEVMDTNEEDEDEEEDNSLATTDQSQPSPPVRAVSTVSADFDSGIENMETDSSSTTTSAKNANNAVGTNNSSNNHHSASSSSSSPPEQLEKRLRTSSSSTEVNEQQQVFNFIKSVFSLDIDLEQQQQQQQQQEEETNNPNYEEIAGELAHVALFAMDEGEYPAGVPKKTVGSVAESRLAYLTACYSRIEEQKIKLKKRASNGPFPDLIRACRVVVLRAAFNTLLAENGPYADSPKVSLLPNSPLTKPLLEQALPHGFFTDLVQEAVQTYEWTEFEAAFSPLLICLSAEARKNGLTTSAYARPLAVMTDLAEIKLTTTDSETSRPFCRLMTSLECWIPEVVSDSDGFETTATSLLGPLFSFSVFAEEDPLVAEKFFSKPGGVNTNKQQLQNDLEFVRVNLHKLIHAVLVNASSRESALDFLAMILKRNSRRAQMHADEKALAGDGFMINLVSVMQQLANKVKLEKIDKYYLHRDGGRLPLPVEETRLKMTDQEWKDFIKAKELNLKERNPMPNFHTECWFLTLQAHHLSVMPCVRRYQRRLRVTRELQKAINELEKSESQWKMHPVLGPRNKNMLNRYKKQLKRFNKAKMAADVGLLDSNLFSRSLNFYSSVCEFLLKMMQGEKKNKNSAETNSENDEKNEGDQEDEEERFVFNPGQKIKLPLDPSSIPLEFASLPEWIIDDFADFLLFALQFSPSIVVDHIDDNILSFLLAAVCTPSYFNNPYLVSKIVEVFFVINPTVQDRTEVLYTRFMTHPICQQHLPSCLMDFYTGKFFN